MADVGFVHERAIITPEFIDLEAPPIMRALLGHILDHADIAGEDAKGRSILRLELPCESWLIDKLAAFGARHEDREEDDGT
jgi:hypothetical protein